ncbi:ribosomal protein S7 domain-containing protein, partial [Vararia minispora EC-137]
PTAQDPLLHFFSSLIMRDGKRKTSDKTIAHMLLHIRAMTRSEPLPILRAAVQRASPFVKCVGMRKGAKMIWYPTALSEKQRAHRGIMAIFEASNKRPGQTLAQRLAREVIAIVIAEKPQDNEVLSKKEQEHKFVMVNRSVVCHP